ncbi:MAG: glycosyltransferase family 2 protein [Candidatus Portnoybacteria bacterium]|nr:glycosyltransferase family 2 protein [Candidatus Portnoybacteria bacterium]MDD4982859.1 glycosyltransferase family 2 protein [Candidatus Portnoybacteria bacterium]
MFCDRKISLVIPCYNEEEGIKKILERRPDFFDEIIVVDNRSTDKSAKVAEGLGAKVVFEARRGYGAAYQAGFRAAGGDVIVTMDGDNSYPIEEVKGLLAVFFDRDLDFISGARFPLKKSGSMKTINKFGNAILTALFFLMTAKRMKDSQSGMWVFKRKVLFSFMLKSKGMALSEEIKMEALLAEGLKFAEVPIGYADRIGEVKLRKWRDGLGNIFFLFKKRAEISFRGVKPEKIGQKLGFTSAFCFFTAFFYFLLFRRAGYPGIFLVGALVAALYFLGRLISRSIYDRKDAFF